MPRDNDESEVVAALAPEPIRRRGRPPGSPRTPGSGRKPGKPNRTTAELREMIQARGRPVELLCSIAAGRRIKTGYRTYEFPNLAERAAAARLLMERLLPAPKADDDAPRDPDLTMDDLAARSGSDLRIELARRAMFMLTQGARAMDEQTDPYESRAPSVEPPEQESGLAQVAPNPKGGPPEPDADTREVPKYAVAAPEPDEPEVSAQLGPKPEPAPAPSTWKYNPFLHGPKAILDD